MIREIDVNQVTESVKKLFIEANVYLPDEVKAALEKSKSNEKNTLALSVIDKLCENYFVAEKSNLPICQDTGMAIVFLEIGRDVHFSGNLADAVNKGVSLAYTDGYLRKSVVTPLDRINTSDNTPAVIHTEIVEGDKVKITALPKGFGSENMSSVKMMNPTSGVEDIIKFVCDTVVSAGGRPCPPLFLGIGIGGSFDYVTYLAKKALARDGKNSDEKIAGLENEILSAVNKTNVGPQGFGGNTTCLGVHIETYPTHIASLPVAVNVSCHVTRHKSTVI